MSTDQSEPIQPTEPIPVTESIQMTKPIQMIEDTPSVVAAPATAPAAATAAAAPLATAPAAPTAPARPALRVGTVVWGLVLAVIGAGVIAVAAGARFDVELASIALLTLAGVALLAGSIATSARRRKR